MRFLRCQTEQATLLLAVPDQAQVLRFPSGGEGGGLPGLHLTLRPLSSVEEQLAAAAGALVGQEVARALSFTDEFADEITRPDGVRTTVFLARLDDPQVRAPLEWPSLPELLRSLPKDRSRLPYMRALQVLAGALTQEVKAIDAEEAFRHLTKD